MKKLLAIGFLSFFALQFAGFYGYFGIRLIAIRKEMKAVLSSLPEEKLERITISANEFAQVNLEEGEIELNGKMYDIAKIKKQGDSYVLFALHDESEDSLLSLLDEMLKRSGNDKKPVPSQLLQFLTMVFIQNTDGISLPTIGSENTSALTFHRNLYSTIERSIPVPPPWV